MRLRFWKWAHDAAESLWHWIYYNRIPEGIAEREHGEAKFQATADMLNAAYRYTFMYADKDGNEIQPPWYR